MKRFYLLVAVLLFDLIYPISVYGQAVENSHLMEKEMRLKKAHKAAPGTFQIIYKDQEHAEAIYSDILYRVEEARDEAEVKYLVVNEFVKIKILPRAWVRSKDFRPLKEYVIGESNEE